MRVALNLACTECKNRNYATMKNKKNNPDRLEIKKYCKFARLTQLTKKQNKYFFIFSAVRRGALSSRVVQMSCKDVMVWAL